MDAKRSLTGALVGAIVLYATGYLIFDLAFANFYRTNVGSATGVDRGGQLVWAMAVANLAYGALITFAIGNRRGTLSIGEGAKVGAIVGCLLWCTVDFYVIQHYKHRKPDADDRRSSARVRSRWHRRRRDCSWS